MCVIGTHTDLSPKEGKMSTTNKGFGRPAGDAGGDTGPERVLTHEDPDRGPTAFKTAHDAARSGKSFGKRNRKPGPMPAPAKKLSLAAAPSGSPERTASMKQVAQDLPRDVFDRVLAEVCPTQRRLVSGEVFDKRAAITEIETTHTGLRPFVIAMDEAFGGTLDPPERVLFRGRGQSAYLLGRVQDARDMMASDEHAGINSLMVSIAVACADFGILRKLAKGGRVTGREHEVTIAGDSYAMVLSSQVISETADFLEEVDWNVFQALTELETAAAKDRKRHYAELDAELHDGVTKHTEVDLLEGTPCRIILDAWTKGGGQITVDSDGETATACASLGSIHRAVNGWIDEGAATVSIENLKRFMMNERLTKRIEGSAWDFLLSIGLPLKRQYALDIRKQDADKALESDLGEAGRMAREISENSGWPVLSTDEFAAEKEGIHVVHVPEFTFKFRRQRGERLVKAEEPHWHVLLVVQRFFEGKVPHIGCHWVTPRVKPVLDEMGYEIGEASVTPERRKGKNFPFSGVRPPLQQLLKRTTRDARDADDGASETKASASPAAFGSSNGVVVEAEEGAGVEVALAAEPAEAPAKAASAVEAKGPPASKPRKGAKRVAAKEVKPKAEAATA